MLKKEQIRLVISWHSKECVNLLRYKINVTVEFFDISLELSTQRLRLQNIIIFSYFLLFFIILITWATLSKRTMNSRALHVSKPPRSMPWCIFLVFLSLPSNFSVRFSSFFCQCVIHWMLYSKRKEKCSPDRLFMSSILNINNKSIELNRTVWCWYRYNIW